jgi:hypothetical protein
MTQKTDTEWWQAALVRAILLSDGSDHENRRQKVALEPAAHCTPRIFLLTAFEN